MPCCWTPGPGSRPAVPIGACASVGDGHLRDALEAQVRRLGLDASVDFVGFRKDVLSWYSGFDIVALELAQ